MSPALAIDLGDIERARQRIDGQVLRTPTVRASALGAVFGIDLFLKLESQQRTGSFKERGALNCLMALPEATRRCGVVTASAGNHAQGLAYHAQRLGIPALVVMPVGTPFVKIERTAAWGARVDLEGEDFAEAEQAAFARAIGHGLALVHPYDDPQVMAGQGTIALEMLADVDALDLLVIPIGGGGLIAGIATAAKTLNPSIRIVGVQVESYAAAVAALTGEARSIGGATLAEGIAVKRPGTKTLPIIEALVDEIVVVGEDAIERAIQRLAEKQHLIAEGAGAAGVAALEQLAPRFQGARIAGVLCGANIDSRPLASVLMRGLVRDGRMVRLTAAIDDQPGNLARLAQVIGQARANIIEINHRRLSLDMPVKTTAVDIMVETRNRTHVREILDALATHGFPAQSNDPD